ncbi:hypothetical protein F4803DRAFT_539335 [Xylaria telfairii]|nr:hypothetical protein F4803DRAFT_539335 [Xylaria telfairii]
MRTCSFCLLYALIFRLPTSTYRPVTYFTSRRDILSPNQYSPRPLGLFASLLAFLTARWRTCVFINSILCFFPPRIPTWLPCIAANINPAPTSRLPFRLSLVSRPFRTNATEPTVFFLITSTFRPIRAIARGLLLVVFIGKYLNTCHQPIFVRSKGHHGPFREVNDFILRREERQPQY